MNEQQFSDWLDGFSWEATFKEDCATVAEGKLSGEKDAAYYLALSKVSYEKYLRMR